jgi:hypothetical protein
MNLWCTILLMSKNTIIMLKWTCLAFFGHGALPLRRLLRHFRLVPILPWFVIDDGHQKELWVSLSFLMKLLTHDMILLLQGTNLVTIHCVFNTCIRMLRYDSNEGSYLISQVVDSNMYVFLKKVLFDSCSHPFSCTWMPWTVVVINWYYSTFKGIECLTLWKQYSASSRLSSLK